MNVAHKKTGKVGILLDKRTEKGVELIQVHYPTRNTKIWAKKSSYRLENYFGVKILIASIIMLAMTLIR